MHSSLVEKKNILVYSAEHCVHYASITTENRFIFISALDSLHNNLSVSVRFVDVTVISPSLISVESYIRYYPKKVNGAAVIIKFI